MSSLETTATLDDASHLTLREPVSLPTAREYRIIVLFDNLEGKPPPTWPEGFFESIRIDDPTFVRPDQGKLEPIEPLNP